MFRIDQPIHLHIRNAPPDVSLADIVALVASDHCGAGQPPTLARMLRDPTTASMYAHVVLLDANAGRIVIARLNGALIDEEHVLQVHEPNRGDNTASMPPTVLEDLSAEAIEAISLRIRESPAGNHAQSGDILPPRDSPKTDQPATETESSGHHQHSTYLKLEHQSDEQYLEELETLDKNSPQNQKSKPRATPASSIVRIENLPPNIKKEKLLKGLVRINCEKGTVVHARLMRPNAVVTLSSVEAAGEVIDAMDGMRVGEYVLRVKELQLERQGNPTKLNEKGQIAAILPEKDQTHKRQRL
ncbi:hypothetical protein HDU83_003575 [Entophlyctis luteolus]|nr:hypothetical protein HDU83_003575 [Entophlyctis luteolus]